MFSEYKELGIKTENQKKVFEHISNKGRVTRVELINDLKKEGITEKQLNGLIISLKRKGLLNNVGNGVYEAEDVSDLGKLKNELLKVLTLYEYSEDKEYNTLLSNVKKLYVSISEDIYIESVRNRLKDNMERKIINIMKGKGMVNRKDLNKVLYKDGFNAITLTGKLRTLDDNDIVKRVYKKNHVYIEDRLESLSGYLNGLIYNLSKRLSEADEDYISAYFKLKGIVKEDVLEEGDYYKDSTKALLDYLRKNSESRVKDIEDYLYGKGFGRLQVSGKINLLREQNLVRREGRGLYSALDVENTYNEFLGRIGYLLGDYRCFLINNQNLVNTSIKVNGFSGYYNKVIRICGNELKKSHIKDNDVLENEVILTEDSSKVYNFVKQKKRFTFNDVKGYLRDFSKEGSTPSFLRDLELKKLIVNTGYGSYRVMGIPNLSDNLEEDLLRLIDEFDRELVEVKGSYEDKMKFYRYFRRMKGSIGIK